MKFGLLVGIGAAFLVHAAVIAFGGLLFAGARKDHVTTQQVELLSADEAVEDEKKKDEPEPEKTDESEVIVDEEPPPDAAEMMRNLELTPLSATPALDALSLSSIEAALSGQSGLGGDFAQSVDFASGGRISGTGKAGAMGGGDDAVFSIAEIDQPPRATLQGAPAYPANMRGKKVEGVVTLLFIVDANGKVTSPRVDSSTHANFEAPALDAVKKWKFEPALRAGQRVPCRMRIDIRFPAN